MSYTKPTSNCCRLMVKNEEGKKCRTFEDLEKSFNRKDQFYSIVIVSRENFLKLRRLDCEVKLFGLEIIERFYLACWHIISTFYWDIYWHLNRFMTNYIVCTPTRKTSYRSQVQNSRDGKFEIEEVGRRYFVRSPPYFEICHYEKDYEHYFIVNKRLKFNLSAMLKLMNCMPINYNFRNCKYFFH